MAPDGGRRPLIAVAVASHARPLRLRWLLNALEEQTLDRSAFDVVVVHDDGPSTQALLDRHPLRPRAIELDARGPARKRNAAWRATAAPLVAFTDDDCRPAPEWLERLLAAARAAPGAIVQGRVVVDPDELAVKLHAPWARSQEVEPPSPFGQTANIAYPRAVLEAAAGFDEALPVPAGEDTDLLLRARATGAPLVAAPDAVVWHAVDAGSLAARLRDTRRWEHFPAVVRKHPQLREHLALGVFWRREHGLALLAAAGLATRRPLLAAPWVAARLGTYGHGPRARARAASELPGRLVLDLAEVAACARGSVRHRTLFL